MSDDTTPQSNTDSVPEIAVGSTALVTASQVRRELLSTRAPVAQEDVLVSFACLTDLTLAHLQRLHYADKGKRTVESMLQKLTKADWIVRYDRGLAKDIRTYAVGGANDQSLPGRLPSAWCLTAKGHTQAKQLEGYPTNDAKGQYRARITERSEMLRNHSLLVTDVAVELIERSRPFGLSGVYVGKDLRLDPAKKKPCMDGLIILHFHTAACGPNVVPWTKDPATTEEKSVRYAVEVDVGTESISTVIAKATEYAKVLRADNGRWRQWWEGLYGRWPFVLLLLPDDMPRFDAVYRGWVEAWPEGAWAMSMQSWLKEDKWARYNSTQKSMDWFAVFSPPKTPQLAQGAPAKPAQLPAPKRALPASTPTKPLAPTPSETIRHETLLQQARAHLLATGHDPLFVEKAVSIDSQHPYVGKACIFFSIETIPEPLRSHAYAVIAQLNEEKQTYQAVTDPTKARLGCVVEKSIVEQYRAERKAREDAEARAKAEAEKRAKAEEIARRRAELQAAMEARRNAEFEAQEQARYAKWGKLYDVYKYSVQLRDNVIIPIALTVWEAFAEFIALLYGGCRAHPRRAIAIIAMLALLGSAAWAYQAQPWRVWGLAAWPWTQIGVVGLCWLVAGGCAFSVAKMDSWESSAKRASLVVVAVVLLLVGVWNVPGASGWVVERWPSWATWNNQNTGPAPQVYQNPGSAQIAPQEPVQPVEAALPGVINGYDVCGQVEITAKTVNMRVEPGIQAELHHKLTQGDILYMLCDEPKTVGQYVWQRVIRDQDVLPGWVATRYLKRIR